MPKSRLMLIALLLTALEPMSMAAPPPKKPVPHPAPQAVQSVESVNLLRTGVAALQQGNDPQAEQTFKQALGKMGPSDPNLLVAYDCLAKLYYRQDKYQQALPYAQKTVPLTMARHGASSISTADAIYLVAGIQHHLNDLTNAQAGYKKAISLYELPQNANQYSTVYSAALQNLGSIAGYDKDFETALRLYQKALAVKEKHQEADTGVILENIGIDYQNQDKLQEAARAYQQALAQYEQVEGKNSPAAKRVYFKMANIQASAAESASADPSGANTQTANAATGRYDGHFYEAAKKAFNEDKNYAEAARQFKLALEQALKYYPGETRFIASLQAALGKALYYAESEEPAEPYLEQALAYESKTLKADEPELLSTHMALGMAYNKRGDYEQAEQHLRYVLAHSPQDADIYRGTLPVLADNLCHQGRFADAKGLFEQELALLQKQPTPDEKQIKSMQYQLALLDKMFRSQNQGLEQYLKYSVDGVRHWSPESGPIQVLVTSEDTYRNWDTRYVTLVEKAFLEWQNALDNKVQFQFTNNPDKSDVVVNWTDKPIAETDVDAQVGVHRLTSVRGFFLTSDIVLVLAKDNKMRTDAEIYATALHEIGHMLGLDHSPNLADIMAEVGNYSMPGKGWPTLTAHDIQNAKLLYVKQAAITNPKGITIAEYRKFNEMADTGIQALRRSDYRQAHHIFEDARARSIPKTPTSISTAASAPSTAAITRPPAIFSRT